MGLKVKVKKKPTDVIKGFKVYRVIFMWYVAYVDKILIIK